jgi:Protein kinase domain
MRRFSWYEMRAMTLEPSPSTVGRWATDLDALRPGGTGFALPMSIAPHLSLWRLIAEGSSFVYEGFDRRMAARVAVKVLAVRDNANAHARLLREAALYANLDHPSVPRLHDVATLPDGTPYVVMEFVAGQTLAELLDQGPLAPSFSCDIANQILGSLAVLHAAGIVHRDIKPTNIILEPGEDGHRRARLVDLGVAKASAFNMAPDKLTQPGALLGTPQYMAPEQFAGTDADARSDLYAVGLLLVELLTGTCPHASNSFADLVAARMRDELDEAPLARAGIGPGLTSFLRTALARDPQARFASAEDMQCELHAARADESCLWMQRPVRRGVGDEAQPVGPIATLLPASHVSPSRVPLDSAVWGVLPDPPAYDDVRRPATRSGVKALLLGFGLTFGVGAILVLRAQTRDATETPSAIIGPSVSNSAPPAAAPVLGDTAAAPLAEPASAGGSGDVVSSPGSARSDQPLGSGSLLGGIPPTDVRSAAEESISAQLSRAAAPLPTPQAFAAPPMRRRERARHSEPKQQPLDVASERAAAQPSALPENPY